MRLIKTDSNPLEMEEFPDQTTPPYAILSHTWGDEEVSYAAFNAPARPNLMGFRKIRECCDLAKSWGIKHVWIDTCCIDKSSSAELSEAINSMWNWYAEAVECYAFLSDIRKDDTAWEEHFTEARWFRRGWTLQELLAPKAVLFFDREWRLLGTKFSLIGLVLKATRIEGEKDLNQPRSACIARKMSWASRRETTRPEDVAYCLLGLFDINMPLLYGERGKAFYRLQQEIIRQSDDESVFAFKTSEERGNMFAASPRDFQDAGHIQTFPSRALKREPYMQTNKGLRFHVLHHVIWKDAAHAKEERDNFDKIRTFPGYVTPINCNDSHKPGHPFLLHFMTDKDSRGRPDKDKLIRVKTTEYESIHLSGKALIPPASQSFYIKSI